MVTWRDGTEKLMAVVIERRSANYWKRIKKRKTRSGSSNHEVQGVGEENSTAICEELAGFKAEEIHYYVHYVSHDRCVLCWCYLWVSHGHGYIHHDHRKLYLRFRNYVTFYI